MTGDEGEASKRRAEALRRRRSEFTEEAEPEHPPRSPHEFIERKMREGDEAAEREGEERETDAPEESEGEERGTDAPEESEGEERGTDAPEESEGER
jgi:hypothetical protein